MALRITPPDLQLPWNASREEDRRFWRILAGCLIPLLLLSVAIPLVDTPEPEREELERLPPQLARVVLEEQELPEPPPQPEPEPEPEEQAPEDSEPEPEPEPEPPPVQTVQQARERAQQSGVLQFADDLAQMRDSMDVSEVTSAEATRSEGEAAKVDRELIANRSNTRSGGLDTSTLSRDVGAAGLSGRETTRVENRQPQGGAAEATAEAGADSGERERTDESIRKIMDRNKSAIFAIYNRALRRDPTLEGRVVVRMVIEPSGQVSSVEVVSSDLNDEDLENKILARIRLINFGAEQVGTTRLNYTFDFLPS